MHKLFLFITLTFLISKQVYGFPYYTSYCSYKNSNNQEMTVVNDFLLSLAIKYQTKAIHTKHNKNKQIQNLHSKAINYFNLYIECNKKNNIPINGFTYYLKAISHFDLRQNSIGLQELDKSIDLSPRLKNAYILKSRILIRDRNLKEAAKTLEDIVPLFSEDSDILFLLGTINAETGHYQKSILYLSSLLNVISKKGGERRYKIHVLKYLGQIYSFIDVDKALEYYRSYLKMRPRDIKVQYNIINLLNNKGNYKKAKALLEKLMKKYPKKSNKAKLIKAEIMFVQSRSSSIGYFEELKQQGVIKQNSLIDGLLYVLQGKTVEAEKIISVFRKKYPKKLSIRLAYIQLLKDTKRYQKLAQELKQTAKIASIYGQYLKAIDLAKELLELSETKPNVKIDLPSLYNFLANCYERKNYPYMALHYIRKATQTTELETDKINYMFHYANVLRRSPIKRYDKSNRVARRILRIDEENVNSYMLLGLNYLAMESYAKSIQAFSQAIHYNEKISNLYFYRANAFDKLGKLDKTIEDLKKAIQLDSKNADAHNYLGYLYTEKDMELQEAFKLINRAVELEPINGAYQDSLGWVYYKLGKIEEAKHHIHLALQLMQDKDEEAPVIYEHLGDIYYKMNDIINANENWKKSLETNKNSSEKKRLRLKLQNISKK